jgi:hypothetical protein
MRRGRIEAATAVRERHRTPGWRQCGDGHRAGKEVPRHDAAGGDLSADRAWDAGDVQRQEQEMRLAMPSHTFHVVQAFEQRDGGSATL